MLYRKLKQQTRQLVMGLTAVMAGGLLLLGSAAAQGVTSGYRADGELSRGMIVRIDEEDTGKVRPLKTEEIDKMHGVVVNPNESPLTIAADGERVFVSSIGQFDVLVSDQNGPINPGDFLSISAVEGVGMKASDIQVLVLGKALSAFNGQDNVAGTVKAKESGGEEKQVNLGRVRADISVTRNPLLKAEANVPEVLRKASSSVAQKEVSANRIYIGIVALFLTSIIAAIVLYAGIRSSMIALGRNPFSRKSIFKGLLQVVITSLIIFLVGLFGVYLLLRL